MRLPLKLLHLHWDFGWRTDGTRAYYQCRCGARRVRRLPEAAMWVPQQPGWPALVDRHGRSIADTGWKQKQEAARERD